MRKIKLAQINEEKVTEEIGNFILGSIIEIPGFTGGVIGLSGGDCDTTGAMFGALAGAKNGIIFPGDWRLNDKEKLLSLGRGIYNLRNRV